MGVGWIILIVILGGAILYVTMLGIFAHALSNEDIGVTTPTTVEDTLEDERRKRELLGSNTILKDTPKSKGQDDHLVKCIDITPIATDPIPNDILKSINKD